jgi:tagatose-1,6-bisphosphate aldolase
VDFDTFTRQVTAACNAGASGIAVGRAVWQEAVTLAETERQAFLRSTASQRLARLTSLCPRALAVPFTNYYSAAAPFDWCSTY